MYSHRLIAFAVFTSLFFTSSSLFAGLTWFLISVRSSNPAVGNDMIHGALKSFPPNQSGKKRQPVEDDETMTEVGGETPTRRFLTSEESRPIYKSLSDKTWRGHQIQKGELSVGSSVSAQEPDPVVSTNTNVKMEEDSTSLEAEAEAETIERRPVSEVSF